MANPFARLMLIMSFDYCSNMPPSGKQAITEQQKIYANKS
jgi:hypothetical protein